MPAQNLIPVSLWILGGGLASLQPPRPDPELERPDRLAALCSVLGLSDEAFMSAFT